MKNSKERFFLVWAMPVLFVLLAFGIAVLVENSGTYPGGKDALGYLYRGNALYGAIQKGDLWPMYDPYWYNGAEMMRYWAPVPVYLLAGCQWLAGGNAMGGYLVFVMVLFLAGAASWLYVGIQVKRPYFGAFLGVLWFFMPNNLYTLFYEGNLPRAFCIAVLPLLFFWAHDYLQNGRWHVLLKIAGCILVFFLCHPGYGGMIVLVFALYLLLDAGIFHGNREGAGDLGRCPGNQGTGKAASRHSWQRHLELILAMVLGWLMAGFWLLPSMAGGVAAGEHPESLGDFFQSVFLSLNPAARMQDGSEVFYFGLSVALLAVFGILLSKRKSMPGFWVGILLLIGSSETAFLLADVLPGREYLQMLRLVSIGLGLVLFSFLIWDTLKKGWVLLFAGLLVLDALPSLPLALGTQSGWEPEERFAYYAEKTLVGEAKGLTGQRLALLDESSLGAMSSYLVAGFGSPVATSYGAAGEAAVTASNIQQVDRALKDGHYRYVFDRCMELGNDTVVIQTDAEGKFRETQWAEMDQAAEQVGYQLMDSNEDYRFYKLDTAKAGMGEISAQQEGRYPGKPDAPSHWGTVTEYRAIGIGTGAPAISRQFPAMEEVASTDLDGFTFEELQGYDLVYLDGFTYEDKAAAERLVEELSEAGVRVVIAADGIPDDRGSRDQSFLGVVCNGVTFSQGYPNLDTIEGMLETDLFPDGHRDWSTVYLEGLDEVWGTVQDLDWELPFFGTVKNENIVLVGLNLTYYYGLTLDEGVGKLLGHAMDLRMDELPRREIVPCQIQYGENRILIETGRDDVNTGLAYHDSFQSGQEVYGKNHLAYVKAGRTEIRLGHPYLGRGIMLTAVAAACLLMVTRHIKYRQQGYRKSHREKNGRER